MNVKSKLASKTVLYILKHIHGSGTGEYVFYFTPSPNKPVPDIHKIASHFNVCFDPNEGEELRLELFKTDIDATLNGEEFGTSRNDAKWVVNKDSNS